MTRESRARAKVLGMLAFVGFLSAGWAGFLWSELVESRTGGEAFCAFGEPGSCASLWDGEMASAVHLRTGLPIAGWGLVWSLAAALAPLLALGRGRSSGPFGAAVPWLASGGLSAVALLLGLSAATGQFCSSCAVSYGLAGAYAAVAFLVPVRSRGTWREGLVTALASILFAWLLLLVPGRATPPAASTAAASALDTGRSVGETRSATVDRFLAGLPEEALDVLADLVREHRAAPTLSPPPAPARRGPADAPVLISEWSDVLCSHCATLHDTLHELEGLVAPGSFAVESRQFPLDGNCNAYLPIRGPETVRCLGARVRICLEGRAAYDELSGVLFAHQRELTPELVFDLAAPFVDPDDLRACVSSDVTTSRLEEDVAIAAQHAPRGTPVVLINGRRGSHYPPFLYLMVLAGGSTDHPAVKRLLARPPK